jgi:hypothetical protein
LQAGQAAAARGDVTAQQHAYVATVALLAALLPVENAEGAAMDADERALCESPLLQTISAPPAATVPELLIVSMKRKDVYTSTLCHAVFTTLPNTQVTIFAADTLVGLLPPHHHFHTYLTHAAAELAGDAELAKRLEAPAPQEGLGGPAAAARLAWGLLLAQSGPETAQGDRRRLQGSGVMLASSWRVLLRVNDRIHGLLPVK